MKTHGEMSVENHRIFPYIAWSLIILFALFTAHLAWSLFESTQKLQQNTSRLEIMANDNSNRLDALEDELIEND